jgi:dolichol-phosphate mannosyltransferase
VTHEVDIAHTERTRRHARRVYRGLRKPGNWMQLVKFGFVGGSGVLVNLAVYSTLVQAADVHYQPAAILAWCVAVTNNFIWNRRWTFKATEGARTFQAPRFFIVSLIALGINLLVLELMVTVVGVSEIPAQVVAIGTATPFNFVGNKLWSFRHHSSVSSST